MDVCWNEVAPGVWSARVGPPSRLTPAGVAGAAPAVEALRNLPPAGFPFPAGTVTAARIGNRLVIRLPLAPEEPVFGMGLQFLALNHRGRTRALRVNSDPRQDTGETHAPVPFYVGGSGYGVLVHSARVVTLHAASTVRRSDPVSVRDRTSDRAWTATPAGSWVEAVVAADGVEVLVFGGPTPLHAVRRYNLYFGGGALPPRWGLGFWHRTPSRFRDAEVLAEADEYRRRGFPCDVIGLEPGWHSSSYPCTYTWSPDRFPDPAGFVRALSENGFAVNLWEHPWVSPHAGVHEPLQPLSGSHTVWGGLAPDLTLPEARAILERQHDDEHLSAGVSGYKLDECDGSELTGNSWMFPAHATFPSGHDGEEMRQVYGLALQRLTAGLFRRRDRRTYGLVRASGAAAPALPYALYTDLYDHRQYVRAMCNASLSGLLFAPEVRAASGAEEWVRRIQVACLSPLAMLDAWSSGTKPWTFPEVEGVVRRWLEWRMRLLPYLYTAFARYRFEGTPPVRAMALLPGVSREAALADDQYMLGEDLLVAPLFAGQGERTVHLPEGTWYDFETGQAFAGGGATTVARGLDAVPLFAREGAVVPLASPLPHAPRTGETVELDVRHFGRRPGRYLLYDDDGETLAFERGAFRWLELRVDVAPEGTRIGHVAPEAATPGPGLAYAPVRWTFVGE